MRALTGVVVLYLAAAYVVIPLAWERYARRHASFDDDPRITLTGDSHPGDPLNVALVGTQAQVKAAILGAGWYPSAALGVRSDLKIASDSLLSRPDDEAPVSSLYLFGRKEDLAFEQPVGDSPRQRHHVRFWKVDRLDSDGRPLWIGSASYDQGVGLSHTTGQITHHISPDVDLERDHVIGSIDATGALLSNYFVDGYHKVCDGHNGGGDPWHTDGRLHVGVIDPELADATDELTKINQSASPTSTLTGPSSE